MADNCMPQTSTEGGGSGVSSRARDITGTQGNNNKRVKSRQNNGWTKIAQRPAGASGRQRLVSGADVECRRQPREGNTET